LTTSSRRPGPANRQSPASRATRRSRRPVRKASFLERYGTRILIAGAVIASVIAVGFAFLSASGPAYACSSRFDPTPAPSFVPAPVASGAPTPTAPPPGYVQPDMGHLHVDPGTKVTYAYCPPASGKHYSAIGLGPITGNKVYGPNDPTVPQGWIHNLEHGAIVLLYACPNGVGPGCTDDGQSALQQLLTQWPNSPICNIPRGALVGGVALTPVITRFDDMDYPYAAVVWDAVLPLQTLDKDAIFAFYAARGEQYNQEKQCSPPSPSPAPVLTTPPSAAPSAGPTSAPTTAPTSAASPAASPAPAAS